MNTVLSSYGQLCGCPEILKKSCKFFCRGLDIRVPQVVKTNGAQSIFIEDIKKDDHFKRKWSSFFYAEQPVC